MAAPTCRKGSAIPDTSWSGEYPLIKLFSVRTKLGTSFLKFVTCSWLCRQISDTNTTPFTKRDNKKCCQAGCFQKWAAAYLLPVLHDFFQPVNFEWSAQTCQSTPELCRKFETRRAPLSYGHTHLMFAVRRGRKATHQHGCALKLSPSSTVQLRGQDLEPSLVKQWLPEYTELVPR